MEFNDFKVSMLCLYYETYFMSQNKAVPGDGADSGADNGASAQPAEDCVARHRPEKTERHQVCCGL